MENRYENHSVEAKLLVLTGMLLTNVHFKENKSSGDEYLEKQLEELYCSFGDVLNQDSRYNEPKVED